MSIKYTFNGTDLAIQRIFRTKRDAVVEALIAKMDQLTQRLEQKIVGEKLAGEVLQTRSGRLASSIKAQPSHIDGSKIIGEVEWATGDAFYGRVFEEGGKGFYAINPRGVEGSQIAKMMRSHKKGTVQQFGQNFLANPDDTSRFSTGFFSKTGVFHEPAKKSSFMKSSIDEMREEFINGLRETVAGVLR